MIEDVKIKLAGLWTALMFCARYQESTIAKVAELLRHLRRNCSTTKTEEVKLYVSRNNSNAHKRI